MDQHAGYPSTDGAGASPRQFVTFQVDRDVFGLPLAEVQEIIRVPELVQVPLCPPGLRGIANLRGAVLPVASLRTMFGAAEAEADDATRIVVVNRGAGAMGFVVDRMASVLTAEPEEIEPADAIAATAHSDLLRGVVKRPTGLILLLDPARLAATGSTAGAAQVTRPAAARAAPGPQTKDQPAPAQAELQLVSFEAAQQEYAFPIEDVQEIVQVPAAITRVPRGPPHLVGVVTLRRRLLPLVSLRRMFGLPGAEVDERSRIVVVAMDGGSAWVGVITDSVKEVLRVSRALIEKVPPLLADDGEAASVFEAICRLQDGGRLVTILSAARMFESEQVRGALAAAGEAVQQEAGVDDSAAAAAVAGDEDEQFVVFRLAGEEYGVPIDAVQEIVRVPEALTRIPKAGAFLEGVVNLRGMVLPVVDQRRRFALDDVARNDRQRIMVLAIGGVRTGFIVDQVSEVLKIARAAIEPAPALAAGQRQVIRRVANLQAQRRMILLLDPADLLEDAELRTLEAL
jgi:purine-binding chemotaxis protein CheW